MQDTHKIHLDTCILCASLMSLWIHIRIHQDTCILGRHFRVLEHTTAYFYQEGFLPSQTEAGEEEDEKEEADDADDADEQPPAKKKKGDKRRRAQLDSVTGGLLSNLGGVVIRIRILCILHVSCMYFACILM